MASGAMPHSGDADVSNKEFEAGLSLLHMLQRAPDASGRSSSSSTSSTSSSLSDSGSDEPRVCPMDSEHGPTSPPSTMATGLNESLLLAAAQQVDPADSGDGLSWQPSRGFLRRNAQLSTLCKELNIEELRAHFGKPIVDVAREFGICTTFLKKICRRCGIKRWPHRQIRSLNRTIEMLRQAEKNTTNVQEKIKYAAQIAEVEAKKRAVIEDPDSNGKLERVKKSVLNRCTSPRPKKVEPPRPIKSAATLVPPPAPTGADMLHAVAVAAAAAAAAAAMVGTSSGSTAADKPVVQTMHVEASSSTSSDDVASASTPTAAALPTPSGADSACPAPLDLKISPSHRKLLSSLKSDGEGRMRSASLGSLRDRDDDVTMAEAAP
ncbi:hypothetical protein P43SY_003495 [Pythium insidiosum]|uniref:RWP-RK domain-containing protein n=1 Tax=Pythium insidiosum TaxID=114742 RepID=A0AAD5Q4T5_PYTIN|nr:hypothetical protein P43SY_003495 [Pythium insidiosum]